MFTGFLIYTVKAASEILRQKQLAKNNILFLLLLNLFTKKNITPQQIIIHGYTCTCQFFLVIEVFQMLQEEKTHVAQQADGNNRKSVRANQNTKFWHFQGHSGI